MNHTRKPLRSLRAAVLLGAGSAFLMSHALTARAADEAPSVPDPVGFLIRTNYHGWDDAILLSNGRVEAVIVPAIARVMQFRFAGETDGPFWENESLYGRLPDPQSTNWLNFGGDKAWPAPQSDWKRVTPRAWPAPAGFDAVPFKAEIHGWEVTLTSPVDPYYGIRTRRVIKLAIDDPVMTITTTFQKVGGQPLLVSVWGVTQLKEAVTVYTPLIPASRFREGYVLQSENPPPSLRARGGGLTLTRSPKQAHKIGTDGSTLIWMSAEVVLRIDSPRQILRTYPDEGASVEVYTSPDPLPYVELEMLGPLTKMKQSEEISRSSTYTLLRRTEADPELEARKLLLR